MKSCTSLVAIIYLVELIHLIRIQMHPRTILVAATSLGIHDFLTPNSFPGFRGTRGIDVFQNRLHRSP